MMLGSIRDFQIPRTTQTILEVYSLNSLPHQTCTFAYKDVTLALFTPQKAQKGSLAKNWAPDKAEVMAKSCGLSRNF